MRAQINTKAQTTSSNSKKMKKISLIASAIILLAACHSKTDPGTDSGAAGNPTPKDTTAYAFKASYSSEFSPSTDHSIAQKVLQVWKYFETNQIEAMYPFFADSVHYEDAGGMHFYGKSSELLAYAGKDYSSLDSLRFDISRWESVHVNDKDEDWVNIWSRERRYPKDRKAKVDTFLMQENWKVKNGRIVYFDQYVRK
jgi:hypothetical protein